MSKSLESSSTMCSSEDRECTLLALHSLAIETGRFELQLTSVSSCEDAPSLTSRVSAGFSHTTTTAVRLGRGTIRITLRHSLRTLQTWRAWISTLRRALPSSLSNN